METLHETGARKKTCSIKTVVFFIGTTLAMGLGVLLVWIGLQENLHGNFADQETGEWDLPYMATILMMPMVPWLLLFWLFSMSAGFELWEKK